MVIRLLKAALYFAVAWLPAGCGPQKNITCKVEEIGGVPRIVLNGKPVRARMLYVSPLYFPLGSPTFRTAYEEMVDTFVEIPPQESPVKNAALEFVPIGKFSCGIYSLTIEEADTGKITYRLDVSGDPRAKLVSNNGGGRMEFKDENGKALRAESEKSGVKIAFEGASFEAGKKYVVRIKLKGDYKFNFNLYSTVNGKFFEPKMRSFVGLQTKLAKDAGIDFITFPVQAADFMPEDGRSHNTENIKGALDEIIGANPNAKILVRIRCYPPKWWMDKYPEDTMRTVDGKLLEKYPGAASPFSARFRNDSAKAVEAIIDFCENYCPENIIGYHPGGANSCEWFYPLFSAWQTIQKTAVRLFVSRLTGDPPPRVRIPWRRGWQNEKRL